MDSYPKGPKLYRALLYAYPAEFRHEYGSEMEDAFAGRLAAEPAARVWMAAALDVFIAAPREHFAILKSDLRVGVRVFAKSPVTTFVALLSMALGIGAATAVFSLVYAVLLRAFPYGDVSRIAYVWTPNPKFTGAPRELGPSVPDFAAWRKEQRSFTELAGFNEGHFRVKSGNSVSNYDGAWVTGNFFQTLRANAELGRTIVPDDDQPGHDLVAVISDAMWHADFGGAPDVLGKTIAHSKQTFVIIGVMPHEFSYPHSSDFPPTILNVERADLWMPFGWAEKRMTERGENFDSLTAFGRLRPGVTIRQAQAEFAAMEARLDPLYPELFRGWRVFVQSFADAAAGEVRLLMWLLLGAVAIVLLIACSNVAGLLTAQAAARVHEMGVRAALGAARGRLVRQVLTESLMLAVAGGALGTALAMGAMRLVVRLNPGNIPRLAEISLDGHVLAFMLAATLLTGIVFGLAPALVASRVDLMELLKSGGRGLAGGQRLRGSLVTTQVALAVVLLSSAGLLLRSYWNVQRVEKGFSLSTITGLIALDLGNDRYATAPKQDAFRHAVLQRVRAIPGVEAAGAVTGAPLSHSESLGFLEVDGYPNSKDQVTDGRRATDGYFEAMGIRVLSGRALAPADRNVVVISKGFADRYFAGRQAVGGKVRLSHNEGAPWFTVIGVVDDVRHSNLEDVPRPVVYQPMGQGIELRLDVAIRATLPPGQVAAALRQIVRDIDPELSVAQFLTMAERVDEASARRRFQAVMLTVFAGIAVFLPLVGLYGLMAYAVKQRTAEIGIRMTLGASRRRVIAMVLRQGIGWVAGGIAVGLAGALASARVAASFLYGITPADPLTFAAVPLFLLIVAMMASLIPAWNAARINPVDALRSE